MPLFRRKTSQPLQTRTPSEPRPPISDSDLADATRLMDQWDASLGSSDAMWNCLEAIGRRGGYKGSAESLIEASDAAARGLPASDVTQRPWRWWNDAARYAHSVGNNALAGRIFLFTYNFQTKIVPDLVVADMLDTGLDPVNEELYRSIAATAVSAMAKLPAELIIHDTASGKLDVRSALELAEQISGTTAPRASQASDALPPSTSKAAQTSGDNKPFNTL